MRKMRDYFKGTELREDPKAFTTEQQRLGKTSLARCRRKTSKPINDSKPIGNGWRRN
jgi:hypothetical protein